MLRKTLFNGHKLISVGHIIGSCLFKLYRTEKRVNVLSLFLFYFPFNKASPTQTQPIVIAQPNHRLGLSVLPQCNSYTTLPVVYCNYA